MFVSAQVFCEVLERNMSFTKGRFQERVMDRKSKTKQNILRKKTKKRDEENNQRGKEKR